MHFLLNLNDTLRKALEEASYAVFIADDNNIIQYHNAEAMKIFGYDESMVGKPINDLVPDRYQKGHLHKMDEFWRENIPRKPGRDRHLNGKKADGSEVLLEINLNPFEIDGKPYVMCNCIDVERKIGPDMLSSFLGKMDSINACLKNQIEST